MENQDLYSQGTLKINFKEYLIASVIILGGLFYLLNISWLKWGDLIIDSGREMYLPLMLLEGKMLYKDISFLYGPLTPYLHAFIFKVLSPSINSLVISGIISTFLTTLLVYRISRFFLDLVSAILTALTFLFVFAFGKYMYIGIFNFILPYTYSATYGLLFALASLYLFIKFIYLQKQKYILGYVFFLSLSFLSRFETGLSLLAVFIFCLIIQFLIHKEKLKIFYSICLTLFLPFLIPGVVFIFLLFKIGSWEILKNNFLDTVLANFNSNNVFITVLSGYDNAGHNFLIMFKSFSVYILVFMAFFLGSYLIFPGGDMENLRQLKLFPGSVLLSFLKKLKLKNEKTAVLTGLFLMIIVLTAAKTYFNPYFQYRSLPLIGVFMTSFALIKLLVFKNQGERKINLSLLALSLFSWILLLRIILNVQAGHYGFYLLVPGVILYYVFFLRLLPDILNYKNPVFYGISVILFVFLAVNHLSVYRYIYRQQSLKIETARGTFYGFDNNREIRCKDLIEFLIKNTRENETLVVMPEGVTINFLSGRDNPLYYYHFLPYDLLRTEVEKDVISRLKKKNPDYIAIVQRSTAEYGYPSFGIDYGQQLFKWINENYGEIKLFGPRPFTTNDFGIVLLKRNPG